MAAAAQPSKFDRTTQNADLTLLMLQALKAEKSLREYTKFIWPVLEPGRPLVFNWHMDAICDHLEAVSSGEIPRLVINVPPGTSKSLMTNVIHPSWEWGPRNQAYLRYLSFAYAQSLTIRDNLRCRRLIMSPLYQHFWGHRFSLVSDQNAKIRYDTDQSGFRMASSIGGTGTGERADRLVLDDPNNVQESESEKILESTLLFFTEVLPSRTTDIQTTSIVVIQQRTGVNDVTGHILKSELGYEWCCLPMEYEKANPCYTPVRRRGVKPERVRLVKLEEETVPRWIKEGVRPTGLVASEGPVRTLTKQDRRTKEGELLDPARFPGKAIEDRLKRPLQSRGGSAAVAGQLQQRPQPRGGSMFQRKHFQIVESSALPAGLAPARGYDLAGSTTKSSAYSAAVKIAVDVEQDRVYVLDVDRVRLEPGEVVEWMQAISEQDGLDCLIDFPQDPGQAGKAQRVFLGGKLQGFRVFSSTETGDKENRAQPLASQNELGNVYLVRGPWNDAFIAEAVNFPKGDFKDQIDAASRGYARALKAARIAPSTEGPRVV